ARFSSMAELFPPSPTPLPSGAARLRRRRQRNSARGVKNTWLIAAIILVFFFGIVWSGHAKDLFGMLYGRGAVLIVVVLIIEYIILKGRDRSRFYKLELLKMRDKRRNYIEFVRNLEAQLDQVESSLKPLADLLPPGDPNQAALQQATHQIEDLRRNLSKNL
ncbi:MAG TPA: hypothetical protein PLA90_02545, partial [Candidatus Sumerlaeota bacterium]|nr:hypothetical protein [Candidatus Sumerlaeota bacterium]